MNEEDKIHINSFKFYDRDELEELTNQYYLENKRLKKQLQQKEDVINSIKEYVKHNEYFYTKGRLQCVDYKINGFKILEFIDNKGE